MDHADRVARAIAAITRKRLLAITRGDFEHEVAATLRDELATAVNDAQLSFQFPEEKDCDK